MRKWDQNGAQMGAEIDAKSEKVGKKACRKSMLNFDIEKYPNGDFGIDFGIHFGAVWGVWGVADFRQDFRQTSFFHLTRHAPPAGVRRMKIYAQMDPKSHPKIAVWAIKGPTFEVFGSVLRNAIFDEFWDVQKVDQK